MTEYLPAFAYQVFFDCYHFHFHLEASMHPTASGYPALKDLPHLFAQVD